MFSFSQKVEWLWVTRWELNWNVRRAWVSGALSVPSCGSVLLKAKEVQLYISALRCTFTVMSNRHSTACCVFLKRLLAPCDVCVKSLSIIHFITCVIVKFEKSISVVILRKMQHRSQGSWKGQAAAQHDCWAWNWQHWSVFSASVIIQVD